MAPPAQGNPTETAKRLEYEQNVVANVLASWGHNENYSVAMAHAELKAALADDRAMPPVAKIVCNPRVQGGSRFPVLMPAGLDLPADTLLYAGPPAAATPMPPVAFVNEKDLECMHAGQFGSLLAFRHKTNDRNFALYAAPISAQPPSADAVDAQIPHHEHRNNW